MGYTKKKICSHAGCNGIALPDSAYCEKHKKNVSRGTSSQYVAYYKTSFWAKERKKFLLSHMWCEKCLEKGKYTLANTVHHKYGFNSFATFKEQKYWVAWCDSCHSSYHTTITNEELYAQNKDKWNNDI